MNNHGGKRPGAGRPRKSEQSNHIERFNRARADREAATARLREMQAAQMAGQLIEADLVLHFWSERTAAARAKLLSLPGKLAVAVINCSTPAEAERRARKLVHEALDELAGSGIPPEVEKRLAALSKRETNA